MHGSDPPSNLALDGRDLRFRITLQRVQDLLPLPAPVPLIGASRRELGDEEQAPEAVLVVPCGASGSQLSLARRKFDPRRGLRGMCVAGTVPEREAGS